MPIWILAGISRRRYASLGCLFDRSAAHPSAVEAQAQRREEIAMGNRSVGYHGLAVYAGGLLSQSVPLTALVWRASTDSELAYFCLPSLVQRVVGSFIHARARALHSLLGR